MTVRAIQWGDGYENTLILGELYNPVTDRPERDGSAHDVDGAGADVAWIEGRDYTLDADIRWVPDLPGGAQTQISGPTAFQGFLDWCRAGNPCRFVPDVTVPYFYVDNCWLVEPRKGFGSFENIRRSVHLTLRNATTDFHLALRGLMFEYAPGSVISSLGLGMSFVRATAGAYRGNPGGLQAPLGATAASGLVRDRHFDGSIKSLLVETLRAQLVPDPENFGAWQVQEGTPTRTSGQADPFGGTAAYLLDDNDGASLERIYEIVTFTGDGEKTVSIFLRQGTSANNLIWLFDSTAGTTRHAVTVTWTAGVPSLTTAGGSGTRFPVEQWGAGWWRISFSALSVVAANSNRIIIDPCNNTAAQTGTVFIFGANAWNAVTPSSYQGPTLTTRNADVLNVPFPFRPQGMFFYYKGIWRNVPLQYARFACIGAFTGNIRLMLFADTTNFIFGTVSVLSTVSLGLAYGDTFELLGYMQPDGKVKVIKSINGAAEVAGSLSAAAVFPEAFSRPTLDIGNEGGTIQDIQEIQLIKLGAFSVAGVTVDTIVKARAA